MAEPLGTGGVDLGAMGQLHGHLPGLEGATSLASSVVPLLAESALYPNSEEQPPAKDYNDEPTTNTVGSQQGQVIKAKRPLTWIPRF